jgi:DNA-binding MarR family transcriptional regulator
MTADTRSLGTILRHLIELLDGDVQAAYDAHSLNYRPRYTPVVRTIDRIGPASIREIADHAGMTHSAVSQTAAQMVKAGLAEMRAGIDGRERIVSATRTLQVMLPQLRTIWAATNEAAEQLESELSFPLSRLLAEATRALERKPFRDRIRDAANTSC